LAIEVPPVSVFEKRQTADITFHFPVSGIYFRHVALNTAVKRVAPLHRIEKAPVHTLASKLAILSEICCTVISPCLYTQMLRRYPKLHHECLSILCISPFTNPVSFYLYMDKPLTA